MLRGGVHADARRRGNRGRRELQHGAMPRAVTGRCVHPDFVVLTRLKRAGEFVVNDLAAIVRPAEFDKRMAQRNPRRFAGPVVLETPIRIGHVDDVQRARGGVHGHARRRNGIRQRDRRGRGSGWGSEWARRDRTSSRPSAGGGENSGRQGEGAASTQARRLADGCVGGFARGGAHQFQDMH